MKTHDLNKTLDEGKFIESTRWTSLEGSKITAGYDFSFMVAAILLGVVVGLVLIVDLRTR